MSDLILHHYPASPFSEKIRLIMGYKKLAWQSVIIPNIMPKPDLQALTGGYRRTPVLQVGADIYCDTSLIVEILEAHQPDPTLYPAAMEGVVRTVAQWADFQLFWSAMSYNLGPKGAAYYFQKVPPEAAKAFMEDRAKMRADLCRLPAGDAAGVYKTYLGMLTHMLSTHSYLFGEVPTLADFSAFHPLWFTQNIPPLAEIFAAFPMVTTWMKRVAECGHGTPSMLSAADAIAVAARSKPVALATEFQDEHSIALGSKVAVTADSFGVEATEGELVAATASRYTLCRQDERAGTVHVHFPRVGFQLKAV